MKELQSADFPLDQSTSFAPTVVLYIRKLKTPSLTLSVYKVTDNLPLVPCLDEAAEAAETAEQSSILKIQQKSLFSRTFFCLNPAGVQVAELSGPLLSFGHWKLAFPDESAHSRHDIELRPVGAGSRADIFVQDSVPYFWDIDVGMQRLFKVVSNARVEVARFTSKHSRHKSGMLTVDDGQVDVVVAVMTSIAVLKRTKSFRK